MWQRSGKAQGSIPPCERSSWGGEPAQLVEGPETSTGPPPPASPVPLPVPGRNGFKSVLTSIADGAGFGGAFGEFASVSSRAKRWAGGRPLAPGGRARLALQRRGGFPPAPCRG